MMVDPSDGVSSYDLWKSFRPWMRQFHLMDTVQRSDERDMSALKPIGNLGGKDARS